MNRLLHKKNSHEKKLIKIKPVINVLSSFALASSILIPLTKPVESHAQLPIQKKVIEAGTFHSLAIGSDGSVYAWGYNNYGQLGDGTTTNRLTPVKVQGLSNVVAIATGYYHSFALTSDGSVYALGYNTYGQVGDGTTINRTTPVKVQGLSNVVAIAGGGYHSLALTSDGSVYAWGWNNNGQLGDGTTTNRLTPVKVQGLSNVVAIATGDYHSFALTSDGSVYAWGYNNYGQLGDGTTINKTTPVKIDGFQANINPGVPSDTTPPDPPVISADKTTPTNGNVTVTITYPSDAVTKEYRINGGAWTPYTSPIVMINNGTIEARAIDQAGNVSDIASYSVTNIDKIQPTNPKVDIDYNTITIMPGTDQGLGVDSVQYRINGGTWTTYDSPITLPDGNYTIEAKTIDKAGNESDVVTVTTTLYGEQLASAQQAVQQASMLKTQSAVDMARIEVNNLPDTAPEKADLSTQLDDVQEEVAQDLVNNALENPTPQTLEEARQSVNKVKDETLKSQLESQLQDIEDQLNNSGQQTDTKMSREAYLALKAIERANKYTYSSLVKYAYTKFNAVPENDAFKTMLEEKFNELKQKYDGIVATQKASNDLKKANALVKSLEMAYSPTLLRSAQDAVNALPDGDDKDILQARIDNVVSSVQNSVNTKKAKEAEDAVANAEKYKTDYYIKKATELVSQLPDGQDKQSLQQRLDALKQTPSEDEINYQKALDAVKLANKYKVSYYYKKAMEAINSVTDESKKQELLQMLNAN